MHYCALPLTSPANISLRKLCGGVRTLSDQNNTTLSPLHSCTSCTYTPFPFPHFLSHTSEAPAHVTYVLDCKNRAGRRRKVRRTEKSRANNGEWWQIVHETWKLRGKKWRVARKTELIHRGNFFSHLPCSSSYLLSFLFLWMLLTLSLLISAEKKREKNWKRGGEDGWERGDVLAYGARGREEKRREDQLSQSDRFTSLLGATNWPRKKQK